MSNKSIHAWTSIAMLAVLAHFSGGSWQALLVLYLISYGVINLMPEDMRVLRDRRYFCVVQLIGIYLLIAQMLPLSARYWPGKSAGIVIPVTLVLLAVYGCTKRPERVGGVLVWTVIFLTIPVVVAGGKDLRIEWVIPKGIHVSVWVVPALLMPLFVRIATGQGQSGKWYRWTGLIGIGIWIMVTGVLSYGVAQMVETPLRNMGQTLSLGPYSRFEAIISIVVTFGWYGFVSLMLYCANQFWAGLGIDQKEMKWGNLIFLLTMMAIGAKIPSEITVVYIVFAWLFLPVFELKKISKKSEKST